VTPTPAACPAVQRSARPLRPGRRRQDRCRLRAASCRPTRRPIGVRVRPDIGVVVASQAFPAYPSGRLLALCHRRHLEPSAAGAGELGTSPNLTVPAAGKSRADDVGRSRAVLDVGGAGREHLLRPDALGRGAWAVSEHVRDEHRSV